MTVYELTENQMNELRHNHFWELVNNNECDYDRAEQIPYETIVKCYEHIYFVNDDFACSVGM